jgi:uncharacterized protein
VRPAAALALAAIRFYQRFVSPYKGFSCALRVATGGASCSAYGYAVIARFGLLRGLGLQQRRFELCGHVHMRTRAPAPPHPLLKHQQGFCDVAGCIFDVGDWGRPSRHEHRRRERRRSSEELDAAAERVMRREARIREEQGR